MALSTTRAAWVVLAAAIGAAAVDGYGWLQAQRLNRAIDRQDAADPGPGAPPHLRFAAAHALQAQAQQGDAGAAEASLSAYRALQADTPLGQAARYNAANALLRQAQRLREAEQAGQSVALIELAKETYREILRHDPSWWDARYNLERAQRLLPDPDETEALPAQIPQNAERAATTMRGVSPGLP